MNWSFITFTILFGLAKKTSAYHIRQSDSTGNIDHTLSNYTPAAIADLITSLPGLDFETNFKQFSGYLTVSEENNRNIFYWFAESQSDPENDPVVFWTNGGPGCSGLIAFGTEHGPFYYSKNGTLTPNPYSWNKVANMFYVEQPAGVGFSYSDVKSDYITGDAKAASDNYILIKKFFERFPEKKSNDFYITSESYGGHYIPELTYQILENNKDDSINFKGFAVGNPYVDPFSNDVALYETQYYHSLISSLVYRPWHKKCTDRHTFHLACIILENKMYFESEPGINPYALDYPVCIEEDGTLGRSVLREQGSQLMQHRDKYNTDVSLNDLSLHEDDEFVAEVKKILDLTPPPEEISRRLKYAKYKPCEINYFTNYLNRKDVREALHILEGLPKWDSCSRIVQYSRSDVNTPLIDFYKKIISRGLENNLNMMVYSGDDDSVCATSGTQYWIYDLDIDVKEDALWNHWYDKDGQVAGYVTAFDTLGGSGNFTFVTVHGAGHELPAYKPEQALEMFTTFLEKKW